MGMHKLGSIAFFGIFFFNVLYKFGPPFLFLALFLGIVGIPLPDELLLIGSGYLVLHKKMNLMATLACAILGSFSGITVSYFLGRVLGMWVIHRWGPFLKLTPERVENTKTWFRRIGKWIFIVGYFIPFVRHLFGFVAGGAKLDFKTFALFAYTGALIWSLSFLALGYFFSEWFVHIFKRPEAAAFLNL